MPESPGVIYWDTSAVLSLLFTDTHSKTAHQWQRAPGLHLISSLAHAEACAVIARLSRNKIIPASLADQALGALEHGIWRRIIALPDWDAVRDLARDTPLRGADLWHLGLSVTLRRDLPELRLLSFDARLREAARLQKMEAPLH
ncbi:MAG: type II toxin-antitoxin system VapC family toxin [Desulfobacterales bacterium]|nr:type II toxin-antitoxin system VapC family toxin [Desulfobacterales bacterium]